MKRLLAYALIFTALFSSCRAKKEIAVSEKADIDNTASIRTYGYTHRIDTAMRRLSFSFDTLDITIHRHAPDTLGSSAIPTETVRIRAIGGHIADQRKQIRDDIAGYNRLDTVAYRRATTTSHAEHTSTTSAAEPPNTTLIFTALGTVIILVIGVFVYLRRRH